jgi:hypothetical protein
MQGKPYEILPQGRNWLKDEYSDDGNDYNPVNKAKLTNIIFIFCYDNE